MKSCSTHKRVFKVNPLLPTYDSYHLIGANRKCRYLGSLARGPMHALCMHLFDWNLTHNHLKFYKNQFFIYEAFKSWCCHKWSKLYNIRPLGKLIIQWGRIKKSCFSFNVGITSLKQHNHTWLTNFISFFFLLSIIF